MLTSCMLVGACSRGTSDEPGTSNVTEDVTVQTAAERRSPLDDEEILAVTAHLLAEQSRDQPNDPAQAMFKAASIDLNGDGENELLVRLESSYHCGSGGCVLRVYKQEVGSLVEISRTTITRLPIGLVEPKEDGWLSLTVGVGGGGMPNGRAILRFDGAKYPYNPTVAPAQATEQLGRVVLDIDSPDYSLAGS